MTTTNTETTVHSTDIVQEAIEKIVDEAGVEKMPFQIKAAVDAARKLQDKQGILLQAHAGLGKTYMVLPVIKYLLDRKLIKIQSDWPMPVLWVTPAAVIPQTLEVINQFGLTHKIFPMSYSAFRGKLGKSLYWESTKNPYNNSKAYAWKPANMPSLVVFDECQGLKNDSSSQTQLSWSIPQGIKRIFISATPYQKVSEARSIVQGVGMETYGEPCTTETVPQLLQDIARWGRPTQLCQAQMERLRTAMKPYAVFVPKVRYKHKTHTRCRLIEFDTAAEREHYDGYFQAFKKKCEEQMRNANFGRNEILVAMQKFREGAEEVRAVRMAKRAIEMAERGRQVIVVFNFVNPMRLAYKALKNAGLSEDRISHIVGGQSPAKREAQRAKFQEGKSDVLLFTMRSGGVGISLHHNSKEGRPRHIIIPPTWSAIDLVQALGRGHRITSISDTTQEVVWYKDTIEETVCARVEAKLDCINASVGRKENWVNVFTNGTVQQDIASDNEYQELEDENLTVQEEETNE
jgi:superfamily II DNA or RNA helicase